MSLCSKLWVRNKPGDEMIDKYNTSSHHGAGEISDMGKSILLTVLFHCITIFIMQKSLAPICLVLALQSNSKMLPSPSPHPRYINSQKTQQTPRILVSG